MIGIAILLAVVVVAVLIGVVVRRRDGAVRAAGGTGPDAGRRRALIAAGAAEGSVTVLHFSAEWCGPCSAVRRVVAAAVDILTGEGHRVLDVEVDMEADPALARDFRVMSLPTTVVLDGDLRERFRASGVPSSADLRAAVTAASRPDAG
ncbi:thioredoxin family protein [Rhodococcoides corynebacterioides]|uniref:Thioredoxin family protein n=1 Tax=Rhodococcoides corynebacterioides TaxID=53972 RepID=A0ABS7NYX0_9NOCA|nr:thioredoxin family protein [Rhodococcus corynebacterioides]MBY6365329.1 thioredoxin family protein [Rhodococcus corynebacterioides]MBY6408140.1 thioredoxin family protein [Rhodococcus corynebacterioides]